MANRPVYFVNCNEDKKELWCRMDVDFQYFNGFALSQKQKCIDSLHTGFQKDYPEMKILEISSKSRDDLGIKLSAFNLMITMKNGKRVSVECAFQAGKIFTCGGPYLDLLDVPSKVAKGDVRLKNGSIIGFEFDGERFPCEPKTAFYFWLYMKGLSENKDLSMLLVQYDAFTDIVFNPAKQINSQAEAAAAYVALYRKGILDEALSSFDTFLKIVYGVERE